ncbi:MAG: hypothetical protein ACOCV1_04760 [Bacillota bacterium]
MNKKLMSFLIIFFLMLSLNGVVFADQVFIGGTKSGDIVLADNEGSLEGWTEPETELRIEDTKMIADEEGYFLFERLKEGEYPLTVKGKEKEDSFVINVEVFEGETTSLDYIDLEKEKVIKKENNPDTFELTEDNPELENIEEETESDVDFGFNPVQVEQSVYIANIDYNKSYESIEGEYSDYNSNGLYASNNIKVPFEIYGQEFSVDFKLDKLFNSQGEEEYSKNDVLFDAYYSNLDSYSYDLNLNYYLDTGMYGKVNALIGYNNYTNELELYSIRSNTQIDAFVKENYKGSGINLGFGYKTNFGYGETNDNKENRGIELSDFDLVFNYLYSKQTVDFSNSRYSSDITVNGSTNYADFGIEYNRDYVTYKLGYFYKTQSTEEQVDSNSKYPALEINSSGLMFSIMREF